MIKKYGLLTAMIVLVLAGCSEAEVSHDPEESMIYVVDDPASMTVHARMVNEGSSDTDTLNFNYDVTDESLLESIDADALIEESEEFTIGANNAFVLNVSIPLSEPLTADELSEELKATSPTSLEMKFTDFHLNKLKKLNCDSFKWKYLGDS